VSDSIPSGLNDVRDDPDQALTLVLAAMDKRWRITVGFWEERSEIINGKRRRFPGQYVHTVRTLEPFDVDGPTGEEYVTCMDATPRHERVPAIRRFRVDRVTDLTVHKRSPYRMRNTYFIGRVRAHAADHAGEGWGKIAALTDEALWSLIERASSTDDAIERATVYAAAHN
jgi:hypothetical protein